MLDKQIIASHHKILTELLALSSQIREHLSQLVVDTENAQILKKVSRSLELLDNYHELIRTNTLDMIELLQQVPKIETISSISVANPEQVPHKILDAVVSIAGVERASLLLPNEQGDFIPQITCHKQDSSLLDVEAFYSQGVIERLRSSEEILFIEDVTSDPELKERPSIRRGQIRSVLALHLKIRGQSLGVIYADNPSNPVVFDRKMQPLLSILVNQMAIIIDNVQLFERVREELKQSKQLTMDLQLSRQRLANIREFERRSLAQELHDFVGTELSGLVHRVDYIQYTLSNDVEKAGQNLTNLQSDLRDLSKYVRVMTHEVFPPALRDYGLPKALEHHILSLNNPNGVRLIFSASDKLPVILPVIESTLYRIALEAVNNVIAHSRATKCEIQIYAESASGTICLSIVDNGVGIGNKRLGLGIQSMKDRATELGGECVIQNRQGAAGTEIFVRIPFYEEAEA